jgi:nucleoside-diphosphate-sugar epimerase
MKVLITGGTGFIGSRLALHSLEKGHDVRILGQTNNAAEEDNNELVQTRGGEIVLGSVTDKEIVEMATAGMDVVFHLAAAQHEANVPDRHFWQVNVDGTHNLIEASLQAKVKRFVHGSTIGVYGSAMQGEIDEETPLRPDNIYGVTKREGEAVVLSFAEQMPVSIVRIPETYGPGDRRLLKLFKAIDKNMFFMIGKGDNKHQLIFVDDLTDGLYLAATIDAAVGQTFLLAGEEVLTTWEMVDTVASVLGTGIRKFRAPLWPFIGTAIVLEWTLAPLGIQPPLHRRRLDFFRKSFFFCCDRAKDILKFQPATTFHDGIAETAAWYRTNGYL